MNDSETICGVARYFIKEYPFVTDGYRLFVALNRVCHGRGAFFNSTPSQKFMLRQLKAIDIPILHEEEKLTFGRKSVAMRLQTNADTDIMAPEMDVALLMLYGHILYSGTSYTSALSKWPLSSTWVLQGGL